MPHSEYRNWIPAGCETYVQQVATRANASSNEVDADVHGLMKENRRIHERDCINLNPATNVMNPRAEAALSAGIGSRPSLGYPGDKYEMGLEAIEQIEVIAQELACEIFNAKFAEIRVGSGALANLYAFMATAEPGDNIIVPPASIGGHVTHNTAGAAGLYRLKIHEAPVAEGRYTYDVDGLRKQARELRPKLITVGGSLNLEPHPVADIRAIADEVGAKVLFDAAHQCGVIAGKAWQQPLEEGAHLMTFSTYKSLGGPPSGLIVSNDAELMERIDAIAFPGLTANFDAAKSAALAITLLDWREYGEAYAAEMVASASALASELAALDLPVYRNNNQFTQSHQFALEAAGWGGGQAAAKLLRQANILTCGIGLPIEAVDGDMNGLRFGTPEIVRWGMTSTDMPVLAQFIARALKDGADMSSMAKEVSAWRQQYNKLHFIRQ